MTPVSGYPVEGEAGTVLRIYVQDESFDFGGDGLWRRACAYARHLSDRDITFTAAFVRGATSIPLNEGWWR